jgi:hypothetical protein
LISGFFTLPFPFLHGLQSNLIVPMRIAETVTLPRSGELLRRREYDLTETTLGWKTSVRNQFRVTSSMLTAEGAENLPSQYRPV